MGGHTDETYCDHIYYALSFNNNGNNNKNNNLNVWKQCENIKLPLAVEQCQCILLNTDNLCPILVIVGGKTKDWKSQNNHWEFKLSDIIGIDNVYTLFMQRKQVF